MNNQNMLFQNTKNCSFLIQLILDPLEWVTMVKEGVNEQVQQLLVVIMTGSPCLIPNISYYSTKHPMVKISLSFSMAECRKQGIKLIFIILCLIKQR